MRADFIFDMISSRILSHEILPGQRLTIDGIARDLDVSQTPVREALLRLEALGLLKKEQYVGYSATDLLTPREFEQLFDFRELVEPWAAAEVALHASAEGIARLYKEAEVAQSIAIDDAVLRYRLMSDHDTRFHSLLMRLSGNDVVADAYDRTHCHLHLFRLYSYRATMIAKAQVHSDAREPDDHFSPASGATTVVEHSRIVECIAAGDREGAKESMLQHIRGSRSRFRIDEHYSGTV